jgi:hypothetical protein
VLALSRALRVLFFRLGTARPAPRRPRITLHNTKQIVDEYLELNRRKNAVLEKRSRQAAAIDPMSASQHLPQTLAVRQRLRMFQKEKKRQEKRFFMVLPFILKLRLSCLCLLCALPVYVCICDLVFCLFGDCDL